jgi:Co/Zn/Cd efflux system component
MQGVFLHVLADTLGKLLTFFIILLKSKQLNDVETLGSVGVIISSLLIQNFGWYIADPLCSICIAVMIFLSVIPLLKHSSSLLLLRTPTNKEAQFKSLLQRV